MSSIDFAPTVKQDLMFRYFDDPAVTEVLYGGAAGSAKSYGISALAIIKCLEYPGIRIGLARNELTVLKKTTMVSFMEVVNDWDISHLINYNSTDGKVTFYNGSEIVLQELRYLPNDPEYTRLGGLLLTFALIDEVGEVDERGYNIYKSRINRWKNQELGVKGKLYMTCNPTKGWLKVKFYDAYIAGELDSKLRFIPALPTDNPYLPQEYLETLEDLPLAQRRRLKYGDWDYDDNPHALIPYEVIQHMYSGNDSWINSSKSKYITADIAFTSDRLVIMVWEGWEVIHIHSTAGSTAKPEDIVKELVVEYNVPWYNVAYDADGVGHYLKNYLPGAHAIVNNGKPYKDENYQHLKAQLSYKFAELANDNRVRIGVTTGQSEIEEELAMIQSVPPKQEGKLQILRKDDIKRKIGRSPDYADALVYRAIFEYVGNKPPSIFTF